MSPDFVHVNRITGQLKSKPPGQVLVGEVLAMFRALILTLALVLAPGVARAIQLHWSSGASDLTFAAATRCTLLVGADASEVTLPTEWRLLWVANHCPYLKALPDSSFSSSSMAQAVSIAPPNAAEAIGHMSTATFQLPNSSVVAAARFVLDLPAGSSGNFQLVALSYAAGDPTSTLILQSGVVTFNGGTSAPFPSAILATSSAHPTSRLTVTAKGVGLAGAQSAGLASADMGWHLPMEVVESTDSTFAAEADVPAWLPEAVVQLTDSNGLGSAAPLVALASPDSIVVDGHSWLINPEPGIVIPKDFAFYYNVVPTQDPNLTHPQWKGLFHLIYIRQRANKVEAGFGHAWSQHLDTWSVDSSAFAEGPTGSWDHQHVFAPSVILNGNTYDMFYTGLDASSNQRIGYVRTALLDTSDTQWATQSDHITIDRRMVFDAANTNWVTQNPVGDITAQQLRDPFVFAHPNPDSIGKFFMLYTAMDNGVTATQANSIGLARNIPGTVDQWIDLGRYGRSVYYNNNIPSASPTVPRINNIESPHMFPNLGSSPSSGWRIMYTWGGNSPPRQGIQFIGAASSATDFADTSGSSTVWNAPQVALDFTSPDTTLSGWTATEYLKVGDSLDFLAGYNKDWKDGINIAMLHWSGGNAFTFQQPSLTAVDYVGAPTAAVRLRLVDFSPRARSIGLRLELPNAIKVRLAVYDVMGRVLRTLLDRELPKGVTLVRWDGTDRDGGAVRSGVYFARMTYPTGNRVARFPIVR